MNEDAGRLLRLISTDAGVDISGLLDELEKVPQQIFKIREKIAPLRAELRLLQSRYESKGRSPSNWDVERGMLLSELKEEARRNYKLRPDTKDTSRGKVAVELTDGRAEDLAHASPRYIEFVAKADTERRRIADLGKEIGVLFDKMETWQGRKEFLVQKIEMARAFVYAFAAEARLTPSGNH